MKKKLTKRQIITIVVVSLIAVVGVVVGIMAINGAFDSCPEGAHRVCDDEYGTGCWCYYGNPRSGNPEKPIIYLYPEEEIEVSVKLGSPEKLAISYPLYDDGWEVLARPTGELKDLKTGRELYSLYWEGNSKDFEVTDEGFVVPRDEAAEFLEDKLAILGLTERETEEFIVYWLPKMMENEYNYVRFATTEEIEDYMPLIIDPSPDTSIRVLMVLRGLDKPVSVIEQELGPTPERNGFTVVEWGGAE